jgi:hypothetical protein
VTLDTTVEFDILLVALLVSSPVMMHEEDFWNFGVLQRA